MVLRKIYPSHAPVWVIDLDKGQFEPGGARFALLAFLRMQMARNPTDEGMISWRLKQAHLELRVDGCRFREGGFAFDYDADGPVPFTKSIERKMASKLDRSGSAGGGASLKGIELGAKGEVSGDNQRSTQTTLEMSISREFRPIALVQSSPHPKWLLRARPPISRDDEYVDFNIFLDGRYISDKGDMTPIAVGTCEDKVVTITPYLIFRPSDVVLIHEEHTGLYQAVGERIARKPERMKEAIVDILLKQSAFVDGYQDEIALKKPALAFQVPDMGEVRK